MLRALQLSEAALRTFSDRHVVLDHSQCDDKC
jgi:hypothetical protein